MVTKIIQVSDIHVHNFRRSDEYREQLEAFINACKVIVEENGSDNTRIVVCGDLFHNKTDISPEAYALASWFLRELDGICKTIVFAGNHDKTDNISRLDPLSVLFSMCRFNQTYFMDRELNYQSGIMKDDNIVWCLYSSFSNFDKPYELEQIKDELKTNGDTFVGLFHGEIKSCKTDTGYVSENGLNANYFRDIDFGLLGHIHKRQCITNDGIPLVYSGSLIQQDHGENISGHGFVVWDVNNCTYDEVDIPNSENNYYTFTINNIDDIDNDLEEIINL